MNTELAWIQAQIDESVRVHRALGEQVTLLAEISRRMARVFQDGGRVFFCGNGGSAADAQHWAAELSGRFYLDRPGLPAMALTTNTSQITAIANDYAYDEVFARPLAGFLQPGDMVVGISTSGNSANVLKALHLARERDAVTVGFTGASGGRMKDVCDYCLCVPSKDVARIQEGHETCAHIVCAHVERALFGQHATVSQG